MTPLEALGAVLLGIMLVVLLLAWTRLPGDDKGSDDPWQRR